MKLLGYELVETDEPMPAHHVTFCSWRYSEWHGMATYAWCHIGMHDLGLVTLADCDGAERMAAGFMAIARTSGPLLIGDLDSLHPLYVMVPRPPRA